MPLLPLDCGFITEKNKAGPTPATNPARPLVILSVSHCDKIHNLISRGRQPAKCSGEKATRRVQQLETVPCNPMLQDRVRACNRLPVEKHDASTQHNTNG